jgi:hypothetical protein
VGVVDVGKTALPLGPKRYHIDIPLQKATYLKELQKHAYYTARPREPSQHGLQNERQ